jgi:flagellar protein FliS
MEAGGEIAENLDSLYDYMLRRLMKAHAENDVAILDEVISLLREIKLGWDGIKP